jgi:hypothetical protein
MGNKVFMAKVWSFFEHDLYTLKQRQKNYTTMITPVVLYGCEMWAMTEKVKFSRNTCKQKILRNVCVSIREQIAGYSELMMDCGLRQKTKYCNNSKIKKTRMKECLMTGP